MPNLKVLPPKEMNLKILPPKEKKEESLLGSVVRNTTRTGVRIGETVAGLPGDIASLGIGLGDIASQKLLGKPFLSSAQQYLPTSDKIRKKITEPFEEKFLPEGYLTPQSPGEILSDEFFSDIASLVTPIPFMSSGKTIKNALKGALGTAAAGSIAKWGAQKVGAPEGVQSGVKIGTMFLSSLGGPGSTKRYIDSLYARAGNLGSHHPEFATIQKEANSLREGLESSTKVGSFLKKHVNIEKFASPKTLGAFGLYHLIGGTSPLKIAKNIGGALVAKGIYSTIQSFENPAVRKYYTKTVQAALRKNIPLAAKYAHQLDRAIREEHEQGDYIVL
jgi:hypothetical protein